MKSIGAVVLAVALAIGAVAAASVLHAAQQGAQRFTGVVTDSMCDDGNHAAMRMGPTDGECAAACVDAHGATWVLADGKTTYLLSDQRAPARFAGQRVTVTGTLDAKTKTITVSAIAAAR
jgi:hypothetical protein